MGLPSVKTYTGSPVGQIIRAQEGTTPGGFLAGDLVRFTTAGQVEIGAAGDYHAIAQHGYTGTQGTVLDVELLSLDKVYVMKSGTTTAQADVGLYGTITFTAGGHTVAPSATGADIVIVGFPSDADVAVSGGFYLVKFVGVAYTAGAGPWKVAQAA